MTKETVRIIEELRKIPDWEWEEVKASLLKLNGNTKQRTSTDFEWEIHQSCKEIGIPPNIRGFKYVQRAIMLTIENPRMSEKITKLLYPTIAKEFETTTSSVERAIRHAITVAFTKGSMTKIHEIFDYSYSDEKGKPTNSEFITGMAYHILN